MSRPYDVLARGPWTAHQVDVRATDATRPSTPALDAHIERTWSRELARAEADGRPLFNGGNLRLVSLESDARGLRLEVGPSWYRDFVGTNVSLGSRVDHIGWQHFANPVGTSAIVRTRDDWYVLGQRGRAVAFHQGATHAFGGMFETCDRDDAGTVDAFASIRRELHEELGLRDEEMTELRALGLVKDRMLQQPELLFALDLPLDVRALAARWRTASSRDEHSALIAVRDGPRALQRFALRQPLVPVARAALDLATGDPRA